MNIVFTPNHGTSYKIVSRDLKMDNFPNVKIVTQQANPDGDFSNTTSANQEELSSYDLASKYLIEYNYDIALAVDPDADRIGMAVYEDSKITYYTGNETASLLISYLLDEKKYSDNSIIYKTIVTGVVGTTLAEQKGIKFEETLTGFKFIGEKIKQNPEFDLLIGFEESYGYLFNDKVRDKDAVQGALAICEMVQFYKNQGKLIKDVLSNIYKKTGYYAEKTLSYNLGEISIVEKVSSYFRKNKPTIIFGYSIKKIVDYNYDNTGLPKSDVIKFILDDGGWIVLRPSGTEPKIKLYTSIPCTSKEESEYIIQEIEKDFKNTVESLK